jgi:beta-lactam-binding protein with PASTA domain
MKKPVVLGIGAVGVAAAAFAVFGSGTAVAVNDYAGMTYADAVAEISDAGESATIATRNGSFLPTIPVGGCCSI